MADMAIEREKQRAAGGTGSTSSGEVTPKKEFVDKLGKDHAEKIENLVQGCDSQEVKDLWDKYGDGIKIGSTDKQGVSCYRPGTGEIHINLEKDASGKKYEGAPPYESTMHESGHNIDYLINTKAGGPEGKPFSETYNDGEFNKTLLKEANDYFKKRQKEYSEKYGRKVNIDETRKTVALEFTAEKAATGGYASTGDVSDILGGATKGKFVGTMGHRKEYWTGTKSEYAFFARPAHLVSGEAFAEFFSATITNPESMKKINEIFPESYNVFQNMLKEANTL